nr:hypothetical protein [Bacteroidales bacterium]
AGTYNGVPVATFVNDNSSCGITNIDASFTWTHSLFTIVCGGSYYNKSVTGGDVSYGYARLAPTFHLSGGWKIGAQALWCSDKTIEKMATDTNIYGMLSLQKDFGKHLSISAQWHDMFCEDLSAANFRLMYYF